MVIDVKQIYKGKKICIGIIYMSKWNLENNIQFNNTLPKPPLDYGSVLPIPSA